MARLLRYKKPRFPNSERFVLVDDAGIDDGPFYVSDFVHGGGGMWMAQTAGRPVFFRITKQKGNEIWTKDGTGKTWHYRMVALAD